MKIAVTGGGGFLGSWVCRQLRERGDEVVALQRSPAPELEALGVVTEAVDIRDAAAVRQAITGCDAVIHTAGKAGAWGPRADYFAINVEGTGNVIRACRELGIRRLVHTSSPSVAHAGGDIEGGDESLPYPAHYEAFYPETKALAEQMIMAASDETLATVSLRPHLVWGPGDNQLLPRLVEKARAGALRLPGADKLIDTVYVENAAAAHLQALDALDTNPACHGKTYFISNGEPVPQAEIITQLLAAVGQPVHIRKISPAMARAAGTVAEAVWRLLKKPGEPPVTRWSAEQLSTAHWYDLTAARRDLGYDPAISLAEGLRRLAASVAAEAGDAGQDHG